MKFGLLLMLAASASAQRVDLSALDKLAERAKESAVVTLDEDKLRMASGFLSSEGDQAKAKTLIGNLKGVYVRTFEFDKKGAYDLKDLEPIRAQVKGAGWSQIVSVKGREENVEVYIHSAGGTVAGLTFLAAEADELAVVNIVGPINLNDLTKLGGTFGIPKMSSGFGPKPSTPPPAAPKKDDDEE